MEKTVRAWYIAAYPNDCRGELLRADFTFDDVVSTLRNKTGDLYFDLFGFIDGIIRDRLFSYIGKDLYGVYGLTKSDLVSLWVD